MVGNVPPLDKVVVPVRALHEEIPDTASAQVKVAASGWLSTYTALLVGLVIETVGAVSSILTFLMGPAVAQLSTLSHTDTELVETLGLVVPAAMGGVVSVTVAWEGMARPEPESVALQVNETVPVCQFVSADGHEMVGALASTLVVTVAVLVLPTASVAVIV